MANLRFDWHPSDDAYDKVFALKIVLDGARAVQWLVNDHDGLDDDEADAAGDLIDSMLQLAVETLDEIEGDLQGNLPGRRPEDYVPFVFDPTRQAAWKAKTEERSAAWRSVRMAKREAVQAARARIKELAKLDAASADPGAARSADAAE